MSEARLIFKVAVYLIIHSISLSKELVKGRGKWAILTDKCVIENYKIFLEMSEESEYL